MGAASCKNTKSPPPTTTTGPKNDNKNITIGVFGLDDAGKTSTVKAIEGNPTNDVTPTISSTTTMVKNPSNDQPDHTNKNPNQKNIKIIDLSGKRSFRQKSWSQFYDQIHGLIYVIDVSERERLNENQETLEDLLENDKLRNKPILILANKQDERGAISSEYELKRQLEIDRLKTKYKIELCTALPQKTKTKVDESIRKGFSWLIRTIEDNYTELNARVMKINTTNNNNTRTTSRFNPSESDDDNKYSKTKNTTDYRGRITTEKLPSINAHKNKKSLYSDDEDDDDDDDRNSSSANRDFNKKKKVIGATNSNEKVVRRTNDNEPKAFRSTYESFPEETPWSSSTLRTTKSDSTLPRLNTKSSLTSDTKRRDVSPLVHDTKSYTNNSLSKRNNHSDDEDTFNRQQTSKTPTRFENSTFSTSRFASNTNKKPTSSIYDDDYYNKNTNRGLTTTTSNKSYNRHDDDDYNDNKPYQRSSSHTNLNSEYRATSAAKLSNHSKFNDDDDDDDHRWSSSKPTTTTTTRSTYNNNDYSNTKSTNRSKYNDDDDDDNRWSSSKPTPARSTYNNNDYSNTKSTARSKYNDDDDDDYHPSSSIKAVSRSNYNNNKDDDDDDDDYRNTSKKTNYSSYGNHISRSHFDTDDFYTKGTGTTNTNSRFRKTTDYDS